MYLLIMRHGECEAQVAQEIVGPDSELTPKGEKQARLTGESLKCEGITHILCSPLVRCLSTASILAETLGIKPVESWHELREGYVPAHTGWGRAFLEERYPLVQFPEQIREDGWDHGRDCYDTFYARSRQVLARITDRFQPDHKVLIVTHGGLVNYLLHAILEIPATSPKWFDMSNCGICQARIFEDPEHGRRSWPLYPPVNAEIVTINDTCHLSGMTAAS